MIINKSLPIVHGQNQSQQLVVWQNTLNQAIRAPQPPPTPLNFTVTNTQGGNQLAWAPVQNPVVKGQLGQQPPGPDGYEILRSPSGSFTSDLTIIKVPGAASSTYFDSIGTTATLVYYRIRATAGTPSMPQSTLGAPSGVVSNTSIAPTDTMTPPTIARDAYTTDAVRATSSRGSYGIAQYQFFKGLGQGGGF